MFSLKEPSPTTIARFKIDTDRARCNAIDTFRLYNVHKIEKGRPLVPFVPHAMLAHQ
jgi:hypothetical protein